MHVRTCIEEGGYNNTRPPSSHFYLRGPGMRPIAPISNGLSHPRTVRTRDRECSIDRVAHDGFRKSIGNRRFPTIVRSYTIEEWMDLVFYLSFYDVRSRMHSDVFEVRA